MVGIADVPRTVVATAPAPTPAIRGRSRAPIACRRPDTRPQRHPPPRDLAPPMPFPPDHPADPPSEHRPTGAAGDASGEAAGRSGGSGAPDDRRPALRLVGTPAKPRGGAAPEARRPGRPGPSIGRASPSRGGLRLADESPPSPSTAGRHRTDAPRGAAADADRRRVAGENRRASDARIDPRWILAARAYAQLQGAILTPERRDRVLRTARRLGVPVFDANLIIAAVQDRARRGQGPADAWETIRGIGEDETSRPAVPPAPAAPGRRRTDAPGRSVPARTAAVAATVSRPASTSTSPAPPTATTRGREPALLRPVPAVPRTDRPTAPDRPARRGRTARRIVRWAAAAMVAGGLAWWVARWITGG